MTTCPICYDDIPANNNQVITDCNHVFCFSCLIKTVQADNGFQCPLCRNDWGWDEYENSSDSSSEYEPDFPDTESPVEDDTPDDNIPSSQCANRNQLIKFCTASYESIKCAYTWVCNKFNAYDTRLEELTAYRTDSAIKITLSVAYCSAVICFYSLWNIMDNASHIYNSGFTIGPQILIANIIIFSATQWVIYNIYNTIYRDMYYYRFRRGQWRP